MEPARSARLRDAAFTFLVLAALTFTFVLSTEEGVALDYWLGIGVLFMLLALGTHVAAGRRD